MFALKRPFNNCPFRKTNGVRLTAQRAHDVAGYFIDGKGATFPCHQTVKDDIDEDDVDAANAGDAVAKDAIDEQWASGGWQMCAGGMLFAHKLGTMSTMMQLGVRLGLMHPDELQDADQVFDSRDEMVAASFDTEGGHDAQQQQRGTRRRRRAAGAKGLGS